MTPAIGWHRAASTPVIGLIIGFLIAVLAGSPAFADPAGPTDYLSTVVAIEPPAPTVAVAIIGGDSFVELVVDEGTEVLVVGYQAEDYLWFQADGTVLENQNSPSKYTNEDRYGGADVPASAVADAEPDWKEIGSDGRWAWHDHRAHWMQSSRPAGLSAGDQILEAVIPLQVDGAEVDVTVISVWQPAASKVPAFLGLLTGLATAAAAWALRRQRAAALLSVPVAAAALVVGTWQYLSLPSETGPRSVWWILPALAAIAAGVAAVAGWRRSTFIAWAATLLAGVELAMWGWIRSDGLAKAIIPTDAPGWLDRFVTSLALAGGIGLTVVAAVELFGLTRRVSDSTEPTDSPLPAQP